MTVKMGDGYRVQAQGRCKELELDIGGYHLTCNPQLFDLGGPDIVLGIEWLKTLGDTVINWQTQTMSFWEQQRWVTLQGARIQGESPVALQSIIASNKLNEPGLLGTRSKREGMSNNDMTIAQQAELQALLQRYDSVFQAKQGLPPSRGREHHINLKEG